MRSRPHLRASLTPCNTSCSAPVPPGTPLGSRTRPICSAGAMAVPACESHDVTAGETRGADRERRSPALGRSGAGLAARPEPPSLSADRARARGRDPGAPALTEGLGPGTSITGQGASRTRRRSRLTEHRRGEPTAGHVANDQQVAASVGLGPEPLRRLARYRVHEDKLSRHPTSELSCDLGRVPGRRGLVYTTYDAHATTLEREARRDPGAERPSRYQLGPIRWKPLLRFVT